MVKRFYKETGVGESSNGFAVLLDGKPVKTPRRTPLVVPTRALAAAIVAEWEAQTGDLAPQTMPLTKLAFAAIDGEHAHIAAGALAYARTDLLCYRAAQPDELVIRQARQWDPVLDWLHRTHGARLKTTPGIGHVEQPPEALARLAKRVERLDPFTLTALHTAVSITGSLALGIALMDGHLTAAQILSLSRLDETYQAEKWGQDAEAEARAAKLQADLEAAERLIKLSH